MASSNAPRHIFHSRLKKQAGIVGLCPTSAVRKIARMKQRVGHRIFLLSAANCLQLFGRFRSWITASPRLVRFVAPAILFAVILAPSIWMLSVIPPLWRDVDAYVQLTLPPGFETILRYGPLYSFAARIPLYVGFAVDCLKAGAAGSKRFVLCSSHTN